MVAREGEDARPRAAQGEAEESGPARRRERVGEAGDEVFSVRLVQAVTRRLPQQFVGALFYRRAEQGGALKVVHGVRAHDLAGQRRARALRFERDVRRDDDELDVGRPAAFDRQHSAVFSHTGRHPAAEQRRRDVVGVSLKLRRVAQQRRVRQLTPAERGAERKTCDDGRRAAAQSPTERDFVAHGEAHVRQAQALALGGQAHRAEDEILAVVRQNRAAPLARAADAAGVGSLRRYAGADGQVEPQGEAEAVEPRAEVRRRGGHAHLDRAPAAARHGVARVPAGVARFVVGNCHGLTLHPFGRDLPRNHHPHPRV